MCNLRHSRQQRLRVAGAVAMLLVWTAVGAQSVSPPAARRIVSLAPHLTELMYAAGAGDRLVAAVDYSNYPLPARQLPRIGNSSGFDTEAILAFKPDLILAWRSGNPAASVERLHQLGLNVHVSEVSRLTEIPELVEELGRLAGSEAQARRRADEFRARYRQLAQRYAGAEPVPVFYQLIDEALLTLNGRHLVSDAIRLCGGQNVFSGLPALVTRVGMEDVLKADPRVIVAGGEEGAWPPWRERWLTWPRLAAVRERHLYFIHADLLHRAGPRMLEGAEQLCAALDRARR
jgi:iron complex transport system substrate-binding protein